MTSGDILITSGPLQQSVTGAGHDQLTDFVVSVLAGAGGANPTGSLTLNGFFTLTATPTCLNIAGNTAVLGFRIDTSGTPGVQPGQGFLTSVQDNDLPVIDPTTTTVSCSPLTLMVGDATSCTATVTDTASAGQTTPTGTVSFSSSGPGGFVGSPCTLSGSGASSATCSVSYTPSAVGSGSHTLTATYGGDTFHSTSPGTTSVAVNPRVPTSKDQCKNGGWRNFAMFKNQGGCVTFVETRK